MSWNGRAGHAHPDVMIAIAGVAILLAIGIPALAGQHYLRAGLALVPAAVLSALIARFYLNR